MNGTDESKAVEDAVEQDVAGRQPAAGVADHARAAESGADGVAREGGRDAGGAVPEGGADEPGQDPAAGGADAAEPGEAVVFRPRKVLVAAWVGAVVIVVVFAVIATVLTQAYTGVYFRAADQVALILLGLIIGGSLLLVARPRARADAAGIEVRNILVTRYVPWSDVRRVAFPDGASWARLDLPDDEYLSVLAVQAVDGERAVVAIRRLRALHAAATRA